MTYKGLSSYGQIGKQHMCVFLCVWEWESGKMWNEIDFHMQQMEWFLFQGLKWQNQN